MVAGGWATSSEHTLNPRTPRVKGEPLLRIREKGPGRERKGKEVTGRERKGKEGKGRERKGRKGKERRGWFGNQPPSHDRAQMSLLGYCTLSLNVSVQSWKKWNLQWMRPYGSSSKKKLARGEKEIHQLLLKFVCCRFAIGFSGPPLFSKGIWNACIGKHLSINWKQCVHQWPLSVWLWLIGWINHGVFWATRGTDGEDRQW